MEAADWGFAPADIKVPVLLWHGEADEDVPVKVGHYLAQQIPGAQSSFVKSESHSMIRRRWGGPGGCLQELVAVAKQQDELSNFNTGMSTKST